jgi:hypothetical protein
MTKKLLTSYIGFPKPETYHIIYLPITLWMKPLAMEGLLFSFSFLSFQYFIVNDFKLD